MTRINPNSGNFFTRIASTKIGQNIYKKMLNPKHDDFYNKTLPIIETTVASSFYVVSTQVQKNIDDKSKKAMQYQNIYSWLFSVLLAIPMNKSVTKLGKNIIKELKPECVKDVNKVINGISVGLPLAVVTCINRFALPVLFTPLSSKMRNRIDKKTGVTTK